MSAIKLSTPSSGSISLSPADTASNLTITVPAISATMATLTTPSFATTIGVGGATPATSGAGITFPSTQSASSDANTLDDYEEGTWTPTVTSTSGSITSYESSGKYVKIGKLVSVFANCYIVNGGTASGELFYSLPFSPVYDSVLQQPSTTSRESYNTGNIYYGWINPNTGYLRIQNSTAGGVSWSNNSNYPIQITYFTS